MVFLSEARIPGSCEGCVTVKSARFLEFSSLDSLTRSLTRFSSHVTSRIMASSANGSRNLMCIKSFCRISAPYKDRHAGSFSNDGELLTFDYSLSPLLVTQAMDQMKLGRLPAVLLRVLSEK